MIRLRAGRRRRLTPARASGGAGETFRRIRYREAPPSGRTLGRPPAASAPSLRRGRLGRSPFRLDRAERERGAASLEMVIIFPIVLLVSLAAVQAGLWMYARSLCLAAAQEGALVGAAIDSSPAQAERAAVVFLEEAAPRFAQVPVVDVARGFEQVSVTVTARIPTVLPGFLDQVEQTAALPVERYT